MTRVKICGITNTDDLRVACEAGADAVGFIFVPGSPRYVGDGREEPRRHPESLSRETRQLIWATPPLVWRFGVFDQMPVNVATFPELHAVQYYHTNSASSALASVTSHVLVKAYRVRDESSLREIGEDLDPRGMILLDAYEPNALGGTGHTFNWELAVEAKRRFGLPIVLAGGLTPENVGDAVRAVRPYMVDVSSGVEAEPGRKDHEKVRRFIRAVREADLG